MLYTIKKHAGGDYYVKNCKTGKVVFYGSRIECDEWIERNGHDGDV